MSSASHWTWTELSRSAGRHIVLEIGLCITKLIPVITQTYLFISFHRQGHTTTLTQLSQLGTEIGTFDSGRAVSFHHKADCSVDGYTPLAVVVSATLH